MKKIFLIIFLIFAIFIFFKTQNLNYEKQKEIKKLIKNFSPLQSFTVLFLNRSVRKSLLSHMIFPLLYNKHLKLYRDWYRIDFTFNIF